MLTLLAANLYVVPPISTGPDVLISTPPDPALILYLFPA